MKSLILQTKCLLEAKIIGLTLHAGYSNPFDSEWSRICGVGCFPTGSLGTVPAEMSKVMQRWQLTLSRGS